MRPRRWPHVGAIIAIATVAAGAPGGGSGGATGADPAIDTVAVAPPAEVPDWRPGPAVLAVTPFENHVQNGRSLDYIVAEAPFELAEKAESVLGLDVAGAPLWVPGERVPPEPDTVADYGQRTGAQWVVTGWFDRPGEQLRLDVIVWHVQHGSARIAGEALHGGAPADYHALLGKAFGDAWSKASGAAIDAPHADRLGRKISEVYPVFLMGNGLGAMTGALAAMAPDGVKGAAKDLAAAEHDLERAVFIDPKLAEAQRLLGELSLAQAPNDPKAAAKAAAKFNYASDLAPEDTAALAAAADASARAGKWEVAAGQLRALVPLRPWDLDARYRLGAALWQLGDARAAEHQLAQVTAHAPDHLAARRVLVLIHASRSDTPRLVAELEAIAAREPDDLDVKGDLATAYGALGRWKDAAAELEAIGKAKPGDAALLVRIGDAHARLGDLDGALAAYQRAAAAAPSSSLPGFAAAQALYDAGKLNEAQRAYTNLQKFTADLPAAEQALGVIALAQHRADDAAWYLRRAVKEAPRDLPTRIAAIAAELARKDAAAALAQVEPALAAWPDEAELHYLAGAAHAMAGESEAARHELDAALALAPAMAKAARARGEVDGGAIAVELTPVLVRPWGDGEALARAVDRFGELTADMAAARAEYQRHLLVMLGALGVGPAAKPGHPPLRGCPVAAIAPSWTAAQRALARFERRGVELEAAYRFIARHDEAGLTAELLPTARAQATAAKHGLALALADVSELHAEWSRGLGGELRAAGCSDALLAAAAADPSRYHVIEEDHAEPPPAHAPPRPTPRATFFVDNAGCPDPIDVWVDGTLVGQVAPGRRSALVADGGERALCLLGPGAAQCGDRGTVRQVYLHDGWTVTMHCPK